MHKDDWLISNKTKIRFEDVAGDTVYTVQATACVKLIKSKKVNSIHTKWEQTTLHTHTHTHTHTHMHTHIHAHTHYPYKRPF